MTSVELYEEITQSIAQCNTMFSCIFYQLLVEPFQNKGRHFKIFSDECRDISEIFSNDFKIASKYFEVTLESLLDDSHLKMLHRDLLPNY